MAKKPLDPKTAWWRAHELVRNQAALKEAVERGKKCPPGSMGDDFLQPDQQSRD